MKNIYNILSVCVLFATIFSCTPVDDITNNNQRHLLAVAIDGQIGRPELPSKLESTNTTSITTYKSLDFSNLALDIVVSPGATVSPASGQAVDFASNGNKYTYTITSESGISKDWVISVEKFINPVEGTWAVDKLEFYYDDWFGWGNSGVVPLVNRLPLSAPGLDDIITFSSVQSVSPTGVVFGSYTRTAGADGAFASYVNELTGSDYGYKFERITGPSGKWQINSDASLTFTDSNGVETSAKTVEVIDANTILVKLDPGPQTWVIDWGDYFGNVENSLNFAWDVLLTLKRV